MKQENICNSCDCDEEICERCKDKKECEDD